MSFQIGDKVRTHVWVGHERRAMGHGVVVAVHSGYCDVNIAPPSAAPWIVGKHNNCLTLICEDWIYEDELPEDYPYEEMFPLSKLGHDGLGGVRIFPKVGEPKAKGARE